MATIGATLRDRLPRRGRAGELPGPPTPADLGAAGAPRPLPRATLGPWLRVGLLALRGMAYLLVAMVVFAFVVRLVR